MKTSKKRHASTLCSHAGLDPSKAGFVNPPSTRGSTYLYPTLAAFKHALSSPPTPEKISYGRYGSETTRKLESALAKLDGAFAAMITSSGFSAISTSILAFVSQGDHVLMIDSAYAPSRHLCDHTLKRFGIDTTFYRPDANENIESLIQANTKVIFVESPGSLTFEVQDLDAIIKIAKQHNIVTIMDNTWASSVNYPAIEKGINVAIQSASKYIGGHSDIMMGVITTDEENWLAVRKSYMEFGHSPGTEETMLALRGLRTLALRIKQQGASALKIAQWLQNHNAIEKIYFPALKSNPYHDLFTKQFTDPGGLFSILLKTDDQTALAAMLEGMQLFSIGESWGGFESLILPSNPAPIRTAKAWQEKGQLLRLSIGLEHEDDLIEDLKNALNRLPLASLDND